MPTFEEVNPEIVYTHHWSDLNIDHRITFDVAMTLCRPGSSNVKSIRCFEIPSATGWRLQEFQPNLFIDATAFFPIKIEALKHYGGEMREAPYYRSYEGIEALAIMRGTFVNMLYAEAFVEVRRLE
jgi:LmbE family N-acetylglucosaminyl deacetylase